MMGPPYYSHIFRDSYGSAMGIVWEAYYKGVPLLGVPENPTEYMHRKWMEHGTMASTCLKAIHKNKMLEFQLLAGIVS